jgi:3-hydroxyacyl-[acyl-carrier-protein] dehydratase
MKLDISEISELLPHRFPFLMIDRVLDLVPGEHCIGLKNVSINEAHFIGHFPGAPTMPGVLIIESMAQTGALILFSIEEHRHKMLYLAGLDKVRFKKPVVPGDTLVNEVRLLWHRRGVGKIECLARVGDDVVAEAEMSYCLVESTP